MSYLDRIIAIPDKEERQSQLVKYAKSLGADPVAAHHKGGCNEEMLVLLVYDAEQKQKERRSHDMNFVGGGFAVLAVLITLISTIPRLFVTMFEKDEAEAMRQAKTLQAFDKEGKPVMEDNKPVLYKLMDGVYKEYDENKNVTYEFNYKMGALIGKKTIDSHGKVIAQETYDDSQ